MAEVCANFGDRSSPSNPVKSAATAAWAASSSGLFPPYLNGKHTVPLHRVHDGVDGDLHFVADAEHQRAGVLHAPFHVGHLERAAHRILTGGGVHRGGEQDLVLHAVNGEQTMQLHLRFTNGSDRAIHAIGTEGDFGVLRTLQYGGVHPLIAAGLPLSPLVASTTSSPDTLPDCGSKLSVPRLRRKSPWTVCSRLPRVNSTLVCAGSTANGLGCEGMDAPAASRRADTQSGTNRRIVFIIR